MTSLSLDSLSQAINAAHTRCQRSYATMLEDAKCAGELLLQAKSQLPHGQWTAWLTSNCAFSDRTAQRYMQIASSWDSLQSKTATVADLGVRMACEMIASEKVLDKPDENKSPTPKPKSQIATHSGIRPGDRIKVTDELSPEYGQELEVAEVVQGAIALVRKGNEAYPLLFNQVEVLERHSSELDRLSSANVSSPTLGDIKPVPADLEAQSNKQHGGNRNLETTKVRTLSAGQGQTYQSAQPTRDQSNGGRGMVGNAFPKSNREVTVAALQDVLRRILDECEEHLPQELIDEARELL